MALSQGGTTHGGLGPPTSTINPPNDSWTGHRVYSWRQLFSCGFVFKDVSSLCQVVKNRPLYVMVFTMMVQIFHKLLFLEFP